ncbi:MAG: ABC transporter permease [Nitriliruptoraceae bacterium]|nr:ABC transporter permease [Nitriliruptoraceae bacterium]
MSVDAPLGVAPPTRRGPTPRTRALLAQTRMELRLLVRSAESLIVTFGIPLGFLAFFSTVDVLPTGDRDAVDFLVPGVLALSVAATGLVAVAIQTAFERKYGVLKRLGTTPLSKRGFLAAKGLAVAGLLAVQSLLVVGLAVGALGWRPTAGLVVVPVLVVLGAVVFTALGLLMAGTLRAEATLAGSNALFLVLLLISGVTFEAEALPDQVAAIGQALPVGALGVALRQALDGGGVAVGAVVGLVVWGVLAIGVASRTFRWEP